MQHTLWRALGRPRPLSLVPLPGSPEWAIALSALRCAARESEVHVRGPISSWQDLWSLTRDNPCPSQITWANLCDGYFLRDITRLEGLPSVGITAPRGGATPLWIALGQPPYHHGVQGRHSNEWRRAADSLRSHLVREGVSFAPPILKSWRRLWISCHGSQPPARTTWAQLCLGRTLSSLSPSPLSPDDATPFPLASWNIRWLVDASSHAVQHKRAALRRQLHLGRVTCIQETHWAPWAAEQWKNLFPTSAVHWSAGVPTARGSHGGGVAILVPHAFRSFGHELVPGYAVQAVCSAHGQPPVRVVSIYLPKGHQGLAIQQIDQQLVRFEGPS